MDAPGHRSTITALASTDYPTSFAKVLTASKDCMILWSFNCESTPMEGHGARLSIRLDQLGIPQTISFAPDACSVAIGFDSSLIVYNVINGATINLDGHIRGITHCKFIKDSDDTILISTSEDRTFKGWNITKNECFYESPFFRHILSPHLRWTMKENNSFWDRRREKFIFSDS
ncbi:hypothetical protein BC829DRAFT_289425 [Chytridium lagenaria]|nr:hypothetical protein BC829DRAFT_289425 [Chytridium lagenaria]